MSLVGREVSVNTNVIGPEKASEPYKLELGVALEPSRKQEFPAYYKWWRWDKGGLEESVIHFESLSGP